MALAFALAFLYLLFHHPFSLLFLYHLYLFHHHLSSYPCLRPLLCYPSLYLFDRLSFLSPYPCLFDRLSFRLHRHHLGLVARHSLLLRQIIACFFVIRIITQCIFKGFNSFFTLFLLHQYIPNIMKCTMLFFFRFSVISCFLISK